jgi:hypothetical protein
MFKYLGSVLQREACIAEKLGKMGKYIMMYLLEA